MFSDILQSTAVLEKANVELVIDVIVDIVTIVLIIEEELSCTLNNHF